MTRIHIPALVHRDVTNRWEPCAYTGKILRLCQMLTSKGHEVFLYSGPENDADVTEHVTVVTAKDRKNWFGDETWEETVFNDYDANGPAWSTMNGRIITEIGKRLGQHDIIGLTMGYTQIALQQAFPHRVIAEVGVGYEGVLHDTPRCFESEAWRHWIYGKTNLNDGRYYDTVIPNAFDPDDCQFSNQKEDYLLFMGRLTERKGLEVVRQLAKHHRVLTAGQGSPVEGAEHLGVVRGKEKAALLAGAKALICATQYIEPFGGVAVEAMMSGTPVIASPFGAFTETIQHGHSGFICHTLADFLAAADSVGDLKPEEVRDWALSRYSLDVCAIKYDGWIKRLGSLYGKGWYEV